MTGYVIRRLLWMIPLLWAIATITFFLMHLVPGGPFSSEKPIPETVQAALDARYNLDKPVWQQYGLYLWDLLHLDMGLSFGGDHEVFGLIKNGFWVSLQLGAFSFVLAIIIGMTLGIIAALNHNRLPDYFSVFFATVGTAMPSFIIATFLVIIFSVKLGWTDVLGWGGPSAPLWNPEFWDPGSWNLRKIVLPVVSLATLPAAFIARITRASMLEVLNQDFIRTARAKGLTESSVVLRHAVKNAMVPILTIMGPIFAFLVTGSFIIEQIFAINGVGRHFVGAVFARDYPVIMGITLFYAAIVAIANLVVDVLYGWVDPRIRYS